MQVAEIEITYRRPDEFFIFPLGDIHIGTKHCAEKSISSKVAEIRALHRTYWIGMGDYSDCITPSDPRWDSGIIADWVHDDNIAHDQEEKVSGLFEPIKDKCLGLLEGNHEETIRRRNHSDIHKNICENLEVKGLGYSCFYKLNFERGGTNKYTVTMMFTHGDGAARTKGARLQNLLATMNEFDADIYGKGHLHDIIIYTRPYIRLSNRNRIKEAHRVGAITGSWLQSYKQDTPASYAEVRGYPPSAIGCPCFIINPDDQTIRVEG